MNQNGITCQRCGNTNRIDAKRCRHCGEPLVRSEPTHRVSPQPPLPRSQVTVPLASQGKPTRRLTAPGFSDLDRKSVV